MANPQVSAWRYGIRQYLHTPPGQDRHPKSLTEAQVMGSVVLDTTTNEGTTDMNRDDEIQRAMDQVQSALAAYDTATIENTMTLLRNAVQDKNFTAIYHEGYSWPGLIGPAILHLGAVVEGDA